LNFSGSQAMTAKLSTLNIEAIAARFGDHISQIIDRHVAAPETPVEEARNQFSAVLERALEGQCQVIGKRRRALLISIDEMAIMLQEASMPPTWGQAFDPTEELPGISTALRIPEDRAPRPQFFPHEQRQSLAKYPDLRPAPAAPEDVLQAQKLEAEQKRL